MKKNLYFRSVLRRQNVLKSFVLDFFLKVASFPRLLLEVFIRKNFGQRYFSLGSAISVSIVMIVLPLIADRLPSFSSDYSYGGDSNSNSHFWLHYTTWYIFLYCFMHFSYMRWREVKSNPSTFDFGRYSLCSGDIDPTFYRVKLFGIESSVRNIETIFEPAFFFVGGFVLFLIGQKIGNLLMVSSIFYSLSYVAAYKNGDDFVLDKIDEIIINEEMESAFVDDVLTDSARGVRFHMRKPKARILRQKLSDSFIETDGKVEEKSYAQ